LRIATYYYLRKGSDSRLFGGFCCAEVLKNNNRHIAALATNRGATRPFHFCDSPAPFSEAGFFACMLFFGIFSAFNASS
jgi:hypothetical protein